MFLAVCLLGSGKAVGLVLGKPPGCGGCVGGHDSQGRLREGCLLWGGAWGYSRVWTCARRTRSFLSLGGLPHGVVGRVRCDCPSGPGGKVEVAKCQRGRGAAVREPAVGVGRTSAGQVWADRGLGALPARNRPCLSGPHPPAPVLPSPQPCCILCRACPPLGMLAFRGWATLLGQQLF